MGRRGFTLLEILVATAILGIILATVYGVLSRAIYAKSHSEERAELYAAGREHVLRVADELEGALPPTAGNGNIGFVGTPGTEQVPTDSVQFVVVVRRQFSASQSRGGRAMVTYWLEPTKDSPNLFALARSEQLLSEPAPEESDDEAADSETGSAPVVSAGYVVDQVAGLRFRYLDPENGEWVEKWDTNEDVRPGQVRRGLPGAVEIVLFLADNSGGIHDFSTKVDLPLMTLPPTPVGGRR